jgi:hypothetical protein
LAHCAVVFTYSDVLKTGRLVLCTANHEVTEAGNGGDRKASIQLIEQLVQESERLLAIGNAPII